MLLETRMRLVAILIGISAFSNVVLAQTPACKSIASESERLACYDKSAQAVKKPGPRPKSHQPPPPELETLLDDVNRRIDDRTKAVCRGC